MGLKPRWDSVAGWKRKLLYLAAGVGLFGLGTDNYQVFSGESENGKPESAATATSRPSMATGFAETSRSGEVTAVARPKGIQQWIPEFTWGGATTRLGLSFAIGFIVALAIRWFIKTALTIAGLLAAGAALLVHYGVIEPFWGENTDFIQIVGHWVAVQTESLATLVKSYLPSGAASGAGIFLGLRK